MPWMNSPFLPTRLDEFALFANATEHVVYLRSATMHYHRVHADQLQQHNVAREGMLQLLIGHGVATVFDDDGLAMKTPDIRQRLGKDLGFLAGVGR
jgi:hypothetical protein